LCVNGPLSFWSYAMWKATTSWNSAFQVARWVLPIVFPFLQSTRYERCDEQHTHKRQISDLMQTRNMLVMIDLKRIT
jgi:hypothetical protein